MSAFDKIIGYQSVKTELERLCDVVKHKEKYQALGVTPPRGLILYGDPGVGKTLIANCFIKESGRQVFVCRKNLPDEKFVEHIKEIFEKAKNAAPSIILFDDLDKFANEDEKHKNAETYVAVQACMDDAKEMDVFVIATANDYYLLPDSLLRAGRLEIKMEITNPSMADAEKIIEHYLKQKNYVGDIDAKYLSRLLNDNNCATLESVINNAGIYAGYEGKEKITQDDIIRACLREIYNSPVTISNSAAYKTAEIAYHEAGHAIVSEILEPNSVTLIATGSNNTYSGFTAYVRSEHYWQSDELMKNRVMCLLAGKCAVELTFGKNDIGATSDFDRAKGVLERMVCEYGLLGFDKLRESRGMGVSESHNYTQIRAINDELTRYYQKTKELIAMNKEFLDKLAKLVMEKDIVTEGEIRTVKSSCTIKLPSII